MDRILIGISGSSLTWESCSPMQCGVITADAWQAHDNMTTQEDISLIRPVSAPCTALRIFPHNVCSAPAPQISQLCEGNIYNLLRTEHSRPLELPRSQSAASPYPFHYRHNNNMHWAQAKMILFGLSLSLSCPEWLMRQNESLTLHLGLILGLTGPGGSVKM